MKALPHPNKQKGAVLILVTVALFVLLGFTALALDGGYLLLNKTRVQDAVDSAALSGAKTLSKKAADIKVDRLTDAENAVYTTLQTIFTGDGFNQVDIDVSNIEDVVKVEFSHKAVPFIDTKDKTARYIRVQLKTVPVNQFFSQLLVDNWQVASAAVAGPEPGGNDAEESKVIPLLVCSKDNNDENFGFNVSTSDSRGDVMAIKTNHHDQNPLGGGNFLALALEGTGADVFKHALAGKVTEKSVVQPGQEVCAEPGNMTGPSLGINTRFGEYKSPFQEPNNMPVSDGDNAYYSDCAIPDLNFVNLSDADFTKANGADSGNIILAQASGKLDLLQSYPEYFDGLKSKEPTMAPKCVSGRRVVKVVVGDCTQTKKCSGNGNNDNASGRVSVPVLDTRCMFLNQKAKGSADQGQGGGQGNGNKGNGNQGNGNGGGLGNSQFIIAEMLDSCFIGGGSGGSSISDRIVLYKNSPNGDS